MGGTRKGDGTGRWAQGNKEALAKCYWEPPGARQNTKLCHPSLPVLNNFLRKEGHKDVQRRHSTADVRHTGHVLSELPGTALRLTGTHKPLCLILHLKTHKCIADWWYRCFKNLVGMELIGKFTLVQKVWKLMHSFFLTYMLFWSILILKYTKSHQQ